MKKWYTLRLLQKDRASYIFRITLEDTFAMLNYLPTSVTDIAISRGFIFVKLCNHEVRENKPSRKVSNLQ